MTRTAKISIGIVLVVLIASALWWIGGQSVQAPEPGLSGGSAPIGTIHGGITPQAADTSDAGLAIDLANLDKEMDGLVSDALTIDQGLNDKPVAQAQ